MNRSLFEAARCVGPGLVLTVKGTFVHAETVRRVRRELGIPFVNYYADNPYCGVPLNPRKSSAQRRDLVHVLREYDRVWIWEEGMAERLRVDGVAATYLPFGVDPETAGALPLDCEECGVRHRVVFVGQHSEKREAHVGAVRRHVVALWGSRWRRAADRFAGRHRMHSQPAFAQRCAGLYRGATAALNIVDDLNMPGHNMRAWEIPAAGGVMLSTYTPEQDEFFPEGEAAFYYRDPGEIDDVLSRLEAQPSLVSRVRDKAEAIARENTYERRVTQMLEEIVP
ncbi:MAG: glycosyltransferase family protein [Thermoanaerobaculia bacterium]